MKTMAGVFLRATLNRSRMRAAATPSNISTNSEPLAEKKATSEDPAMALARYVFPVPGGTLQQDPLLVAQAGQKLVKACSEMGPMQCGADGGYQHIGPSSLGFMFWHHAPA